MQDNTSPNKSEAHFKTILHAMLGGTLPISQKEKTEKQRDITVL